MQFKILIIDDEPAQLQSISLFLKRRGHVIQTARSGEQGIETFAESPADLVLTDFRMTGLTGLDVVKKIKAINPETPVVVITAFSDTASAIEVMKAGAYDYLSKPINLDELALLVQRTFERTRLLIENREIKMQLSQNVQSNQFIFKSEKMERILNMTGRVAASKSTVLIRGESGTGKELIARTIFEASERNNAPFITVNCAALSSNLLESELFGHVKGAYTGAHTERRGRFEEADGGTLFLDEFGDIDLQTQVKLLRALQFGEFEKVGSSEPQHTDVRIIAATNRNLEQMVQEKTFREDLFYRINVVTIDLPPLRERKTDIPYLIEHFLDTYTKLLQREVTQFSPQAKKALLHYSYPGNIRELENIVERSVVLARGTVIETEDLPENISQNPEAQLLDPVNLSPGYEAKMQGFERNLLENALSETLGNQSKAAELLKISERHFRSRMQKIGLVNRFKS